MSTPPRQRSAPSQARSRAAVARILDATAALIDERGIEAVTTRAIAARAGVTIPSLYRFFADRDDIFDSLLERHVATLDARAVAAEQTWRLDSIEDLVDGELDLHVAFFEEQSSAARLWFSGRTSPIVAKHVRERMKRLAERMRAALGRAV